VQEPRSFARQARIGLAAVVVSGGVAAASAACDPPPPVKSASGERIAGVSYEEKFPLSNDGHEVVFHGDRLRRAVELLDKHGAMGLTGDFQAAGVLDKSTLVLVVRDTGGKERKLVMKNCAEPHVCAFFADAVASGLADKPPVVCRDAVACAAKK
jgi:hypothetical protein